MHYIVGTQVVVTGRSLSSKKPLQGMTGAQIRSMSSGTSNFQKERQQFTPDSTYTLTRVCKDRESENIIYTFNNGIDIVPVPFSDITTAEEFISELKNEQLPDYSDAYVNRTD